MPEGEKETRGYGQRFATVSFTADPHLVAATRRECERRRISFSELMRETLKKSLSTPGVPRELELLRSAVQDIRPVLSGLGTLIGVQGRAQALQLAGKPMTLEDYLNGLLLGLREIEKVSPGVLADLKKLYRDCGIPEAKFDNPPVAKRADANVARRARRG